MNSETENEKRLTVAFQGETGAYSEQAALTALGENISLLPQPSFKDVFESLITGLVERAVIPIENSTAGSIHENYDLLLHYETSIIAEQYLRISHNLLTLPETQIGDIKRVISHPQALGQCSDFLSNMQHVTVEAAHDTAGSARLIAEKRLTDTAAIASAGAAEEYDLKIIRKGIENNHHNHTRFLVLSSKLRETVEQADKTSIVFSTRDIPGALFKSMAAFSLRDINLLKIESRPLVDKPFHYYFYLDFEGSREDEPVRRALHHLEETTGFLQILGSYKRGALR